MFPTGIVTFPSVLLAIGGLLITLTPKEKVLMFTPSDAWKLTVKFVGKVENEGLNMK